MVIPSPLAPRLHSQRHGPRRRTAAAAVPVLPDDALVDILSRLPDKSLCRFKCVSKAWRDLISDRLRCNKLPQTLARFFVYHGDEEQEGVNSDRIVRRRFINTLGRLVPLASLSVLGKEPGFEDIHILHSCNGLLLFGHRRDTYGSLGYIVCNPATEQWVAVPRPVWKPYSDESDGDDSDEEGGDRYPLNYLIFDPAVSSHFQLIQLVQLVTDDDACVEEVHTYSSQTGV
ncbi:hypothetical protein HU200_060955 [Digitaria exilis]|uniref:F-box domain-containing protein n=1 Tax=Digitaria exilis TaxID=1010633 RepID=A0A835A599_9POAL|nr:hypothetical protein HU200_060955 [Digitaria exilis]